jgi:signal transduction histidine kinase
VARRRSSDLDAVLGAIARTAARVCEARDALIYLVEGDHHRLVAKYGRLPQPQRVGDTHPVRPDTPLGQAVLRRRPVHVADIQAVRHRRFPGLVRLGLGVSTVRTVLVMPLVRDADTLGGIVIRHTRVGAFSTRQVDLLRTFADQAAIAIENARLSEALQARNAELTATSDLLRIISQSPTDLGPVLQALGERAADLCEATDALIYRLEGDALRLVAAHGTMASLPLGETVPLTRGYPTGRAVLDRRTIRIVDLGAEVDTEFPESRSTQARSGTRSALATPLLREGTAIGALLVRRTERRPFTDRQVALLETFASQAVIAIENVRLFTELQSSNRELTEALQQQTATAEILRVISGSPTDVQPVFDAIVANAVRLCGATYGLVWRYTAGLVDLAATANVPEREVEALRRLFPRPLDDETLFLHRAVRTGRVHELHDVDQVPDVPPALRERWRARAVRSVVVVPMGREGDIVGAIGVSHHEVGGFPPSRVALLKTFADQAVIAIENVRLFTELQAKSRDLEVASRHKSQFLASMSHELRTPLNAILGYTELIADGIYGEVSDRMREVLERLEASGRHLLGLINDVLDLSKIEAGQLTLTLAPYSLKEVVDSVVAAVEPLAAAKGLRLLVHMAPALPGGHGDQRRLAQVLLNLVGNAIKFTEQGHVEVQVAARDGVFELAVQDTGPGIAPADHERIFEEFQQVDGGLTRPHGGTGLGLAIARRIVGMHGGRLWVESAPGEGAVFKFFVPVQLTQPRPPIGRPAP